MEFSIDNLINNFIFVRQTSRVYDLCHLPDINKRPVVASPAELTPSGRGLPLIAYDKLISYL